jgi:hypothetical protein
MLTKDTSLCTLTITIVLETLAIKDSSIGCQKCASVKSRPVLVFTDANFLYYVLLIIRMISSRIRVVMNRDMKRESVRKRENGDSARDTRRGCEKGERGNREERVGREVKRDIVYSRRKE